MTFLLITSAGFGILGALAIQLARASKRGERLARRLRR